MTNSKLHIWEASLLLALALTLLAGVWSSASQAALAAQVLRLHVVANSDSAADQALKLEVRDAVLARATPLLEGIRDPREAEEAILDHLDELTRAGQEVLAREDSSYALSLSVENQWFPTRNYGTFALPAGNYRALRVVIGEGAGQNWWCVVFPPLCLASVSEEVVDTAAQSGLSDGQISLITGRDGRYVLKFRFIEWWEELRRTWK